MDVDDIVLDGLVGAVWRRGMEEERQGWELVCVCVCMRVYAWGEKGALTGLAKKVRARHREQKKSRLGG